MVAEEELRSRRAGANPGNGTGNGLGTSEIDSLFAHARTELTSLYGSLRRIAFVEWQGLQLRALDVAFRGALFFCAAIFAIAMIVSAARFLVSGFHGAILAMGAPLWLSDLGAAVLVLLIVFGGGLAASSFAKKKFIKKVEQRLKDFPVNGAKPAAREEQHEFGRTPHQ
ncbi:MAG TPA: hypothetical protein VM509_08460 [Planctomycetota bacterium]|nr:hypothetical protein [Planctomycetota bacterium]